MTAPEWICAFVACGQPEGEPHVEDCPYRPTLAATEGDTR